MPELTVLMAVYNAEAYLREAIESILNQTFTDFEFLIINDGSTDASKSIIFTYKDPRIRLLDNPQNLGLTPTLNRGLSEITTPLIARQDADDISHPKRFEKQVAFLKTHPQIALVGSQGYNINAKGNQQGFMYRALENFSIRWEFLFYNSFIHTAVTYRRDVVCTQFGGYDETIRYGEDYVLWAHVMRHHQVANLPEPLISRRVHETSMTHTLHDIRLSETIQGGKHHLQTLFGTDKLNDAYETLLIFLQTQNQGSFAPNYSTFHHLLKEYEARNPQLSSSREFQQTVCRQYIRMISQLQNKNRLHGLHMALKSLQQMPKYMFSMPWHRIIAKTFLP